MTAFVDVSSHTVSALATPLSSTPSLLLAGGMLGAVFVGLGSALLFLHRRLNTVSVQSSPSHQRREAQRAHKDLQQAQALGVMASDGYVLAADHEAVVNVLKSEIADLRSSVLALEVRMQALKQRQDHQLQAMAGGRDSEERTASFTGEDLVALARQGWRAEDLARMAHLSRAEAELLTRLHGQKPQPPAPRDVHPH
ncbi:MAG: hypothetical protein ABF296_08375 [Oceanococcaceae bacterium]